jgi:putative ABC transport system permease protein
VKRTQLRLGVRLARRELRRRPWRTALVLLVVLLPSTAMSLVVVSVRTAQWDAADEQRARHGRADITAYPDQLGDEQLDALLAAMPGRTTMQVARQDHDRVRLPGRRVYLNVSDERIDHPMNEGRFGPVTGRLPANGSQVVLTRDLADALDRGVGDRIHLDGLDRDVQVVGVVLARTSGEVAYVGERLPTDPYTSQVVTFDVPDELDPSQVAESVAVPGWTLEPEHRPAESAVGIFWAYVGGGVGLVVLGTVITAAFAVGARRQLRSIGLLAASGASPRTVKWFLVTQGALAGLSGALLGIGLALVGLRFVPDRYVEQVARRPVAGPIVRPLDLVPILVIGSVVAAAAAWLPARSAAAVPTLQALAGRRPLPRVPRRLPVLGALSVAAGCGLLATAVAGSRGESSSSLWALLAIGGGLGVVLGAIAVAPWVVSGLERLGRRLRPGGRLASRSLARNRVRSSAVIGAITAVAIVVVAGATLYESRPADVGPSLPYQREDQVLVDSSSPVAGESVARPVPGLIARIRRAVPGARAIPLLQPKLPAPTVAGVPTHSVGPAFEPDTGMDQAPLRGIAVATEPLLDHLQVPADLRAALDRGEVIAPMEVPRDLVRVGLTRAAGPGIDGAEATFPFGGSFDSPKLSSSTAYLLVSEAALAGAGVGTEPSPSTLIVLPEETSSAQRDRLELLRDDIEWEHRFDGAEPRSTEQAWYVTVTVPSGPAVVSPREVKALLMATAALVVLAVVAVGLALAAQDEAEERQILAAVGAPPRTTRRITAMKAALLVFIAGALAVPAGLLPAAAIEAAADADRWELRPDVASLVLVTVVVPLLAGGATWAGGRLRTLVRPTRPDVFAFGD